MEISVSDSEPEERHNQGNTERVVGEAKTDDKDYAEDEISEAEAGSEADSDPEEAEIWKVSTGFSVATRY